MSLILYFLSLSSKEALDHKYHNVTSTYLNAWRRLQKKIKYWEMSSKLHLRSMMCIFLRPPSSKNFLRWRNCSSSTMRCYLTHVGRGIQKQLKELYNKAASSTNQPPPNARRDLERRRNFFKCLACRQVTLICPVIVCWARLFSEACPIR